MVEQREIEKVLIANRGEIAVRVARTLRDLGITPVAVYSEIDRGAPHVRACDQAVAIGASPANESYLKGDVVIAAAKRVGADAIHPGYGFLSENAAFAAAVVDAGLVFIGPPAGAMRAMGSKTAARAAAMAARVPVVPGSDGPVVSVEVAEKVADKLGYPVLLKAAAGGGGKGMRFVHEPAELESAWRAARSEAKSAFGDDTVYLEKAVVSPKHIEIQIFGDQHGNVVWLGERECSMQRRHQKIVEETPSLAVSDALRAEMGEVACRAAAAVGYVGAGTCEFLLDARGAYYFLEMNTRLQVEHPITELCCGTDLVEAQVRVAQGEPVPWQQSEIRRSGHAIEARLYAEDPERDFLPSPGRIDDLVLPQGPGVRVDSGVERGFEVPRFYDPMLAKISVWAPDRERARKGLLRALAETVVKGPVTNVAFLREVLACPAFIDGSYHTGTVAELLRGPRPSPPAELADIAIAAAVVARYRQDLDKARQTAITGEPGTRWRNGQPWRGGV